MGRPARSSCSHGAFTNPETRAYGEDGLPDHSCTSSLSWSHTSDAVYVDVFETGWRTPNEPRPRPRPRSRPGPNQDHEPPVAIRVRSSRRARRQGSRNPRGPRERIDWLVSRDPRTVHGWLLAGLDRISSSACSRMHARRRSSSASTRARPRSSWPSRTPTACITWSSHAVRAPEGAAGRPPDWYKSLPYRSRAVSDRRRVLREFGVELPADVEVRVVDSTAASATSSSRAARTAPTGMNEDELAALVTRDSMIGVAQAREPATA